MLRIGNRRRSRSDTFAPKRLGGAALVGLGMLAWKWWRNRQESGPRTSPANRFDEGSTATTGFSEPSGL
jgi:hypothetical protein